MSKFSAGKYRSWLRIQPIDYVRGDLHPSNPDIEPLDVTSLRFSDNYFDFIICNHVLEHVLELNEGLSELFRVLKPGGIAIFQTPYSEVLHHTIEDPGINTDELRLFFYAQEDHVRLFGKDLFKKIEIVGFSVSVRSHKEILPDLDHVTHGVNPMESLITAEK